MIFTKQQTPRLGTKRALKTNAFRGLGEFRIASFGGGILVMMESTT